VKAKARQRIEEAADRMARELLKMATDDNVADSVKLAAIRDALDRAGLATKNAVEVEVGPPKPYQVILETIEAGSRDEYRRSQHAIEANDGGRGVAGSHPELAAPSGVEVADEAHAGQAIAISRRRTMRNLGNGVT
jgi:hypothetical protein